MTRVNHAQERALERYGLRVSKSDLIEMAATLGTQNLVQAQEGGGIHALTWGDVPVLVGAIYEPGRFPVITTFLPPERMTAGNARRWERWKHKKPRRSRNKPQGPRPQVRYEQHDTDD